MERGRLSDPVRIAGAGVAFAFFASTFAGCVGLVSGDEEGTVPMPLVGDSIQWMENQTPVTVTVVSHTESLLELLEQRISKQDSEKRSLWVDRASNLVVADAEPCPNCTNRRFSREMAGQPWAMGSSVFQGRTLALGTTFDQTFYAPHFPIRVKYTVIEAEGSGADLRFRVQAKAPPGVMPSLRGTWWVSTTSPFFERHTSVNETEYTIGAGPEVAVGGTPWQAPQAAANAQPLGPHGWPAKTNLSIAADEATLTQYWSELLEGERVAKDDRLVAVTYPSAVESSQVSIVSSRTSHTASFTLASDEDVYTASVTNTCNTNIAQNSCSMRRANPQEEKAEMPAPNLPKVGVPLEDAYVAASALVPGTPASVTIESRNGPSTGSVLRERYFLYTFSAIDEGGRPSSVTLDAYTGLVFASSNAGSVEMFLGSSAGAFA